MTDGTTHRTIVAALYSAQLEASYLLMQMAEAPMHLESRPTIARTNAIEAAMALEDAAWHLRRAADMASPICADEERVV